MIWDETTITVRFNEVDAYKVAWHGQYISWMETGRYNLAAKFGLDPFQLTELGFMGPVVQLELKYLRPARYGDVLTVRTGLEPSETATMVFVSEIVDAAGKRLATGRVIHALTDLDAVLQFRLTGEVAERVRRLQQWAAGDTP